jgi:hypothetical protein
MSKNSKIPNRALAKSSQKSILDDIKQTSMLLTRTKDGRQQIAQTSTLVDFIRKKGRDGNRVLGGRNPGCSGREMNGRRAVEE